MTHIYLRQRFEGIEIDGANVNYNILENGLIANSGGRFIKNIHQLTTSNTPTISQKQALEIAFSELGIDYNSLPTIIENRGAVDQKVVFDRGDVALENMCSSIDLYPY